MVHYLVLFFLYIESEVGLTMWTEFEGGGIGLRRFGPILTYLLTYLLTYY
jgi:hypothetical protein